MRKQRLVVADCLIGLAIGAAMKPLVGGEFKDLTKLLAEGCRAPRSATSRTPAVWSRRDCRLPVRHFEMGTSGTEIVAWGTAVRMRPFG